MKRITKCVESLKIAYLSRVPIAWVVVKEKEVADQIASSFIDQHLGHGGIGNSYPLKHISALASDIILKKPDNKAEATVPVVYFGWVDDSNQKMQERRNGSIESLLSDYLDFYLNIEFEPTSGEAIRTTSKCHVWDRNFVIITSPTPPSLGWINPYIETIYLSPIQDEEIRKIIYDFKNSNRVCIPDDLVDQLVVNFRGVSKRQIEIVLSKCLAEEFFDMPLFFEKEQNIQERRIVEDSREKILNEIRKIKRQMLEGFKGLKWISIKENEPQATGLDAITSWLQERQFIFSDPEASVLQGFDIPKGLLITGIPGTGKSLMAKQTAQILKLPLIAMDLGDIQEGIVGKSEEHMADALRKVDAMAPCVLWIDEIEKAFSGAESGQSDGGVMRRMFGKFLTWMQEKESFSFVLATSNDITKLPPELFRSQRFDEKYYTFMPTAKECAETLVAKIRLQNERIVDSKGHKNYIFDGSIFEKESYWLHFLNEICTCNIDSQGNLHHEDVMLEKNGQWLKGYLPQKKLFTGADIATFVNALKFCILSQRKNNESPNYGFNGPIKRIEADHFIPFVLRDFIPYGQSNLKDIALCFRTLTKNRFKSASVTTEEDNIVRFSDYNELTESMAYHPDQFKNSKYDKMLYMCIVGAINSIPKERPQDNINRDSQTK